MIVSAAYKVHADKVLVGQRHHEFLPQLIALGERMTQTRQGFLTDEGEFLTRYAAMLHAKACGQIPQDFNRVLTSEDLW